MLQEVDAMTVVAKTFDSYLLTYYSQYTYDALIQCYQGTQLVATIVFWPDAAALPQNDYTTVERVDGTYPVLFVHYPLRRFPDVITTLRTSDELLLVGV